MSGKRGRTPSPRRRKPSRGAAGAASEQEEAQRQRQGVGGEPSPSRAAGDILVFPLAHSVGEITEEGIGPQREAALRKVMGVYPFLAAEVAETLLARGRASHKDLLDRAGQGEAVRVWTGPGPDDACGLAWLAHTLRPPGTGEGLRNPSGAAGLLGAARRHGDPLEQLGEMEPWMWGRLAQTGRRRRPIFSGAWRGRGRTSRGENAPLRAVVNGRLMSVPEDWYDPFLRREIAARPAEFSAAQVVGTVLGKYQLGIGDGELTCRLEAMVQGENSSR